MSRALNGHLEIQNFFSWFEKISVVFCAHLWNIFQPSKQDYWNLHVAMLYSLSLCLLTEYLQPFYSQWTVTLTVAIAGVSTPLLAVHWYWIMLSGVPGLLTFTMVSNDVLESTSELPSLVQVMTGWGLPDVLQVSVMLSPSSTVFVILWIVIDGESINIKVNRKK